MASFPGRGAVRLIQRPSQVGDPVRGDDDRAHPTLPVGRLVQDLTARGVPQSEVQPQGQRVQLIALFPQVDGPLQQDVRQTRGMFEHRPVVRAERVVGEDGDEVDTGALPGHPLRDPPAPTTGVTVVRAAPVTPRGLLRRLHRRQQDATLGRPVTVTLRPPVVVGDRDRRRQVGRRIREQGGKSATHRRTRELFLDGDEPFLVEAGAPGVFGLDGVEDRDEGGVPGYLEHGYAVGTGGVHQSVRNCRIEQSGAETHRRDLRFRQPGDVAGEGGGLPRQGDADGEDDRMRGEELAGIGELGRLDDAEPGVRSGGHDRPQVQLALGVEPGQGEGRRCVTHGRSVQICGHSSPDGT